MKVLSSGNFWNLTYVGGELNFEENEFGNDLFPRGTFLTMLPHVEVVGGGLDVNANLLRIPFDYFDILPKLKSLCSASKDGLCLQIRNNEGYGCIRGFTDLWAFNGFLSITGNIHFNFITGFPQTTSLAFSIVHAQENVVTDGALGALAVAFNPDLRLIDGFDGLSMVSFQLQATFTSIL